MKVKHAVAVTSVLLALVVVMVAQTSPQRAQALASLNAGIQDYRNERHDAAIENFRKAIALDAELIDAQFYLARAYAAQYAPGLQGRENQERGASAIAAFERVLARAPDNVDAVAGLARMYQATGQLRKARELFLRTTRMAPATAAPFFAVGAIDWSIVVDSAAPPPVVEQAQLIAEGLQHLDRALAFDPLHGDAMLYENLLLREQARMATDKAEKSALLARADEWFDKALKSRGGPKTAPRETIINDLPLLFGPEIFSVPFFSHAVIPDLARPNDATRDPGSVRIGILHSLTGTMAISEVSLRDAVMLAVREINESGGVLGRRIEPMIVDPASNWELFAHKAQQLLQADKVAAVFGCWTSVSRKSVLPVFESTRGLLFYPIPYEGQEQSPNIIYTGAVPNQQAIPAVEYLISREGGSKKKFYLLGTDYVYPRTVNRILKEFLRSKGLPEANIVEEYTPFGHSDYQAIVRKIKDFARDGNAAVISSINGDSNVPFYMEFANQGLQAGTTPIMALSIAEEELRSMPTDRIAGHLAVWNYFQSIDTPENKAFVMAYRNFLKSTAPRVTDDPIESAYSGVYLWKAAVEKAGSFDVDKVIPAILGMEIDAPGGKKKMDPVNHHMIKRALIGRVRADGQFDIISRSEPIAPEVFSPFLQGRP